jgi:hypothetical protein
LHDALEQLRNECLHVTRISCIERELQHSIDDAAVQ